MRHERHPRSLALTLFGLTIAFFCLSWFAESVTPSESSAALTQLLATIDRAAEDRLISGRPSEAAALEAAGILKDLKDLVRANLVLREDADRAANWALWTLRLVSAISFIIFGASLLGGYTLLTSSKEQAAILSTCQQLRDSSKDAVDRINEDAREMKTLLHDFKLRTSAAVSAFETTFASFDFSRLDAAAATLETLFSTSDGYLAADEKARLEDYDVQILVGEMLGARIAAQTYLKLGRYYHHINAFGTAVVRFERALQRDSGLIEAWLGKALCLGVMSRDFPGSEMAKDTVRRGLEDVRVARRAERTDDDKFHVAFIEGWLHDELGEYDRAISAYHRSRHFRDVPHIDYNIACSLVKQGRKDEAMAQLEAKAAAMRETASLMRGLKEDADFEHLRRDPAFADRFNTLIGARQTNAAEAPGRTGSARADA